MKLVSMTAAAAASAALATTPPALAQTPVWVTTGFVPDAELGADLSPAGDLNGDGFEDLVAGAPGAEEAYVLSGLDGSVLLKTSPSFGGFTRFGSTVAGGEDIDGDGVEDIAVGAPWGDGATVFSGVDGSTIFNVTSTACGGYEMAREVQFLGDVTGDGISDVAVVDGGDSGDVPGGFVLWNLDPQATGSASSVLTIVDCNCWCPDITGYTVTRAGDVDGDGVDDYAFSDTWTGLHVYKGGTPSTLLFKKQLWVPYSDPSGGAPPHVAGVGDVNQDGFDDVAVVVRVSGGSHVFRVHLGPNGNLAYSFPTTADRVIGVGDVNLDGLDDFLLGSPEDDTIGVDAGAAFLHSGADGALLQSYFGQAAGDRFGTGLVLIDDVSGDGGPDVAIGAPEAGPGTVTVFDLPGEPLPQPFTYCTAKVSSAGCTPRIDWGGDPTLSGPDDYLVLTRDALPGKPGLFFWGSTGSVTAPFFGGVLCVQPGLTRTTVQNAMGASDCNGGYAFHFSQSYMTTEGLTPGDTVNGQYWTRDPTHPDGTGVGLTDAIEFAIWP